MLKVLLTIDTEVYPLVPDWRADNLCRDIRRDLYGKTQDGSYGVSYQIEKLNEFGLKAVFFVEGLFASGVGIEPLRELVGRITAGGHEVQLHLHPEWLAWMADPPVRPAGRWMTNQFSLDEQTVLIERGIQNLAAAGAPPVAAFRAGDYAGNLDTLTALARNGLSYDTSYNFCYPCSFAGVSELRAATQMTVLSDVCEVPVSYWRTWPLGSRHAQFVCASLAELKAALWHARRHDWDAFVVVSHSFEFLKDRRRRVAEPAADPVVLKRFLGLCRFLHDHRDEFQTCGFNDLCPAGGPPDGRKPPLGSPPWRTTGRIIQQLLRRLSGRGRAPAASPAN